MKNKVLIEVNHVSKKFCKREGPGMKYGFSDIAKTIFGATTHSEQLRPWEFWALDDVSFQVKKGETLGVIGANGSGKSTLLRLLNGIFLPDMGKIKVRGKLGALISVGAGFHELLTGRENIYVNASILSMRKGEVDKNFKKIVEFADIGDFLDTPVKYYSSGMVVRLGFSIAIHCVPDILLVDEVLSVGDASFREKSRLKMKEIAKGERVVIFVSHNVRSIEDFTSKTLYLKNGRVEALGKTKEVTKKYLADQAKNSNPKK